MFSRSRPYAGIQVAATSKPLRFRIANGALGVFKRRPCLLASRFQTEPPANQIGEYPALHLPLDLWRTYTPSDSPKEYTLAGSGGVRLVACLPRHPRKEGLSCSGALFHLAFFVSAIYGLVEPARCDLGCFRADRHANISHRKQSRVCHKLRVQRFWYQETHEGLVHMGIFKNPGMFFFFLFQPRTHQPVL